MAGKFVVICKTMRRRGLYEGNMTRASMGKMHEVRRAHPRANFWLAMFLGWLWLAAMGCTGSYPVLERPQTPPDAKVNNLLGGDRLESFALAGVKTGWMHRYQDGSRLAAVRLADSDQGMHVIKLWQKMLEARQPKLATSLINVGSNSYLSYHTGGLQGLAWTSGVWVFVAEARDADALSHLLEASTLGGIASGQMSRAIFRYLWIILPVAIIAALASPLFMMNLIARWVAIKPKEGVVPVSRQELQERLLALNDQARPFRIAPGEKADLVAEWNLVDATWWEAFQKAGLQEAYRLRLALDESRHEVRSFEEMGSIEWGGGPEVHFERTWFGGIVLFHKEGAVAYGLNSLTPPEAGKIYDYSFDIAEIKGPIIDIVTGAGWRFAPCLYTWQVKRTA